MSSTAAACLQPPDRGSDKRLPVKYLPCTPLTCLHELPQLTSAFLMLVCLVLVMMMEMMMLSQENFKPTCLLAPQDLLAPWDLLGP